MGCLKLRVGPPGTTRRGVGVGGVSAGVALPLFVGVSSSVARDYGMPVRASLFSTASHASPLRIAATAQHQNSPSSPMKKLTPKPHPSLSPMREREGNRDGRGVDKTKGRGGRGKHGGTGEDEGERGSVEGENGGERTLLRSTSTHTHTQRIDTHTHTRAHLKRK